MRTWWLSSRLNEAAARRGKCVGSYLVLRGSVGGTSAFRTGLMLASRQLALLSLLVAALGQVLEAESVARGAVFAGYRLFINHSLTDE
jgi:hypothetical protein